MIELNIIQSGAHRMGGLCVCRIKNSDTDNSRSWGDKGLRTGVSRPTGFTSIWGNPKWPWGMLSAREHIQSRCWRPLSLYAPPLLIAPHFSRSNTWAANSYLFLVEVAECAGRGDFSIVERFCYQELSVFFEVPLPPVLRLWGHASWGLPRSVSCPFRILNPKYARSPLSTPAKFTIRSA